METYYTKKEYNEMKAILNRKLKAAEKKIAKLEEENTLLKTQIKGLEDYPLHVTVELEKETHVTED